MSKRALRYQTAEEMPAGMRSLLAAQQAPKTARAAPVADANAPGWLPQTGKRANKYGAVPTVVDGIRFDSKREARYYERLKLEVAAGRVRYFLRQVPIHLPGGTKLVVDFLEHRADGSVHMVDAKGRETKEFRIKKREVEHHYPFEIELV